MRHHKNKSSTFSIDLSEPLNAIVGIEYVWAINDFRYCPCSRLSALPFILDYVVTLVSMHKRNLSPVGKCHRIAPCLLRGYPVTWNGFPIMLHQVPIDHSSSFFTTLRVVLFDRGWTESTPE